MLKSPDQVRGKSSENDCQNPNKCEKVPFALQEVLLQRSPIGKSEISDVDSVSLAELDS
jgi:hypothetical protein